MRQNETALEVQKQKEQAASIHVGALCRVEAFDPTAMTVDVQPLSRVLDAGVYRTPPPVLGVPVALIRGGGFVLRPWYVQGDVGAIVYMDHDIDRIVEAGQESQPNTERSHASEDAVFVGAFVPASNRLSGLPENALVMATDGGGLYIALKPDVIEIKGDIRLTGNVTQKGDIVQTGNITQNGSTTATGDVIAGGVSLITHTHPGVHGQTGGPG